MKNVETQVIGNILTIKVDITKTFGPSKSGKTIIIASTEGNTRVGDVTIGLNVYKGRQ
jgi:ABC-type molybdate transport system ATPase subunit